MFDLLMLGLLVIATVGVAGLIVGLDRLTAATDRPL